jgi:hypothetical protein
MDNEWTNDGIAIQPISYSRRYGVINGIDDSHNFEWLTCAFVGPKISMQGSQDPANHRAFKVQCGPSGGSPLPQFRRPNEVQKLNISAPRRRVFEIGE